MAFVSVMSFALRGGSAAAKFLFVIYLAGKTNTTLLGELAIVMTVTAAFTQIAGLEINQVIGRQLHTLAADARLQILKFHACAALVAYLVLVPLILLIYADVLASHWISACGILVLEHVITEIYRFNILMLRQVYASSLLFIKNAGWVVCFVLLVEFEFFEPSLALVFHCWFAVLALAVAPTIFTRHAWHTLRQFLSPSTWLKRTSSLVWQARPFIMSAVAVAGVSSIDKLLIGEIFSTTELGIYFFFSTFASIMTLIVSFSIGATIGPQCIKIYSTEGKAAYQRKYRRLKQLYWLTAATMTLALIAPANFLLALFGKTDYQHYVEVLYFLVPSTALVVLCEPYKITAYLERRDFSLFIGNMFHLCSLFICTSLFALKRDIIWVAAGVFFSSLLTYLFFSLDIANRVIGQRKPRFA